jgi:hypothetical protein
MLKIAFFLCIVLLCNSSNAQFGPLQIISTEADLPVGIECGDVDGDGFLDILSVARSTNNIAWYKNLDGQGSFSDINLIAESEENKNIAIGDLDNDGDLDVLATASFLDIVFWLENLDGAGSFSTPKIIDNVDGAFDVAVGDFDNDGLLDIVHVSISARMIWHKNLGNGVFSDGIMIAEFETNGSSVNCVDIDGDGDLDILNSNSGNVTVNWYENTDGLGTFGPANTIDTASPAFSTVSAIGADIDGDGDMDVVTAATGNTFISWHENLDGLGTFGSVQLISNQVETAITVFAADLDNDDDIDVLSASVMDGKIAWYENDGVGNFASQQIITDELNSPRDVIAADIDADGDMDVFSVSQNDDTIAWYENLTILGINRNDLSRVTIHPNPVKDTLHINLNNAQITGLKIYTLLGQKIYSASEKINKVVMSQYPSGIYFIEITSNKAKTIKRIFKF